MSQHDRPVDVFLSECDGAERFISISSGHRMWFGCESEQIVGRTVREMLGDPAYALIQPAVAAALAGQETVLEVDAPLRALGTRRVRCTCVPRMSEAGSPQGFLMLFADLTVRAESEAAWKDALLRSDDARVLAEQTVRMKDDFVATVSHELRTPLNAVLGWTAMLRTDHLDKSTMRAITAIERNARATSILVEDLLDASRMIRGMFQIVHEVIDVRKVVERAIEAIAPAAHAKQLTFEGPAPGDTAAVRGDSMRLQQAFSNIFSNAVRHTPPGGRVSVELVTDDAAVTVRVRDTGDGIEPAFLGTLFKRFEQGPSATNRSHGGLGLGLAIARHIVDSHRGTIRVESDGPKQGATFIVSIPRELNATSARARRDAAREALASSAASVADVRVLYVADDSDVSALVRSVLQDAGAMVTLADSAEAVKILRADSVDVLVCDMDVAKDAGEFMRAFPADTRVPSCALSSYVRVGDRTQNFAAGFQTVLRKPVDCAELIAAVAGLAGLSKHVGSRVRDELSK
jgi:signal transduction histidine kinase